jgi:hypothetical protein
MKFFKGKRWRKDKQKMCVANNIMVILKYIKFLFLSLIMFDVIFYGIIA